MIRNFLIIILSIAVLVSSCNDDEFIDTTAPEITLNSPENSGSLMAGDFVELRANFSDDRELATYNIEIHENFDGHAHGRIAGVSDDPSLTKWSYNQSFLIPGGNTDFLVESDDEILVPENALAGPYHFIVRAIDQAGNATSNQDGSTVEHEFFMMNDSQPIINMTNLNNGELDLETGILFIAEGDVTDPTIGVFAGMYALDIILGEGSHESHDHDHGGRISEEDLIDVSMEGNSLEAYMIDEAIILNKVFESINFKLTEDQLADLKSEGIDHLILTIRAYDNQGNIAVSNTDVHVHMD